MNIQYHIRRARISDLANIIDFNCKMAEETENKTLDKDIVTKGVTGLLKNSDYGFYILAEHNHKVVGQLMVTYEWSDWRNGLFWWIQSVYVIEEYRRKGVYRAMYHYIHNICQEQANICGIRLYVEKSNDIAQQTYSNLGMSKAHYDIFEEDFVLGAEN